MRSASNPYHIQNTAEDVYPRGLALARRSLQGRRPHLRRHAGVSSVGRHDHLLLPRPAQGRMDSPLRDRATHELVSVGAGAQDYRPGEVSGGGKHGGHDEAGSARPHERLHQAHLPAKGRGRIRKVLAMQRVGVG